MTVAEVPVREQAAAPASVPAMRRPRRAVLPAAALLGLVAVSVLLRVEAIATWYWIDEALSVGLARHDVTEIPSLLLRDGSPPLWYVLLHGWMRLFGTSATATHALSVVFAVATVPAAWIAGRRLFGDRTGWFAAAVAAVNPFITHFATETRMYSLVVLLGLAVCGTFVATFVDRRDRTAPWLALSLVALLYTHNWGIYTAIACGLALVPVAVASADRSGILRRAALVFGLVVLAYLPWVPALLSQIQNTGAPWSFTPSARDIVRELAALFRDERILGVIAVAAGAGLAPLARRWRSRDALAALTLVLLVAVPIGIGWAVAHVEPSWATRYLAVVVGPLVVLVGLGLSRAGIAGIAALGVLAVLVVQPVTRFNGLTVPLDAKSNIRQLAAHIAPRLGEDDVVLVAQPEAVPLLRAELGPGIAFASPLGLVEEPDVMDWRDAETRLRSAGVGPLASVVDAVPVGGRLALVTPTRQRAETDTAWIELFRVAGQRARTLLQADPTFVVVDRMKGARRPYASYDVVVWERVASSRP